MTAAPVPRARMVFHAAPQLPSASIAAISCALSAKPSTSMLAAIRSDGLVLASGKCAPPALVQSRRGRANQPGAVRRYETTLRENRITPIFQQFEHSKISAQSAGQNLKSTTARKLKNVPYVHQGRQPALPPNMDIRSNPPVLLDGQNQ
jgi:hypothetical protein